MTRHYIYLLIIIFLSQFSFGQKIDLYYVSISIDSSQGGRLKFLNDSTIELSSEPRHMSPFLKRTYKYKSTDSTIEILPEALSKETNHVQGIYKDTSTINTKVILTKIDRGFIVYNKSLIYVLQNNFGKNPDIAYIIDGKTYIQDMGVTDGYGLIKKESKKNKALQKRLKTINKDNCTIEIVKGLNAYKRFGISRVYGVVVISTKK